MRRIWMWAVLALCCCAGGSSARGAKPHPVEDLLPVARAMSAIERAELRGAAREEQARRLEDLSAHPEDVIAQFLALYASPKDETSWNGFRRLTERFEQSPWGHVGMARIYLEWGTLDQAEAELQRARAKAPRNWLVTRMRGELAERKGKDSEADRAYREVLEQDPKNAEAHLGRARIHLRAQRPEEAHQEAAAAVASDPENVGALVLLADLARAERKLEEAAELLGRAVSASPRDVGARVALAKLRAEMGDDRAASSHWTAAQELSGDPELLRPTSAAAQKAGDLQAEARALERMVELEPGNGPAWRRLGEVRSRLKDDEGAEAALQKALEIDSRDAPSHLLLADIYERQGEWGKAVGALRASGTADQARLQALHRRINIERVSGKDLAAVQRAVGKLIDRTYRARLAQAPGLSGTLKLRAAVDAAGSATAVEVLQDSVHDQAVQACAFWNLKDASYPKGQPGRFTFVFQLRDVP